MNNDLLLGLAAASLYSLPSTALGAGASLVGNAIGGQTLQDTAINSILGGLGAGVGSLGGGMSAAYLSKFNPTATIAGYVGGGALGALAGNLARWKSKEDRLLEQAAQYAQANPQGSIVVRTA